MTCLHRIVLGAALVAGLTGSIARAAEPDKLLPATTEAVVQINVRQVLQSDLSKKYALQQLKQVLEGQDLKRITSELGLDPLADIDQLILAVSGSSKDDAKVMAILHGKFNPEKLNKAAKTYARKEPEKVSEIKDGDTEMFKFLPDNVPPVYVRVINQTTIVAGTEPKLIVAAQAASMSSQSPPLKKEMAALIEKMDAQASVNVAGIIKGKLDDLKLPANKDLPINIAAFQDLLPKIETFLLTLSVKADIVMEVTVGMKDDMAATSFRTAFEELLKQLKPLAQFAGAAQPQAKPLVDILNTIQTTARNKDVMIKGKVTGDNISKAINPEG